MSFLASGSHASPAAVLLGVPFDGTSTFRSGSRYGPDAIRWASQSIETYSPVQRAALDDVAFADRGNADLPGPAASSMVQTVAQAVQSLPAGAVPVLLGGEHTITLGGVTAVAATHQDLAVIQMDAHADLRDSYEGLAVSHATVMRRIADQLGPDRLIQLGVRAGTAEEFAYASASLRYHSGGLNVPSAVWEWLRSRPVYVSVDIDVLDPAEAPGTGNPEPEGISGRDLLAFIRRLGQLQVVGFDLVEVSPPYDPSARTAVMAATIIREAILAIVHGRGPGSRVRGPK